jgi:hypothetical protein
VAATIVQSKSGSLDTAGLSMTVALDNPVSSGNILIINIASGSTVTMPSGFTAPMGGSQINSHAHYFWYKIADSNQQSFTITQNAARTVAWSILEVSGITNTNSVIISAGQISGSANNNSYTTPVISVTPGSRFIVAALSAGKDNAVLGVSGWTNGYTEITDSYSSPTSGDHFALALATLSQSFASIQDTSTGATYDSAITPLSNGGIIVAFNVGTSDVTPPSTPLNLKVVKRTNTTVSLTWDASTDDTGVNGYDLYLNGSSTATTSSNTNSCILRGLTEATTYSIVIKSRDVGGLSSTASLPLVISTLEGSGRYYWDGTTKHLLGLRTVDTLNILSLPLIPWEGGPAYWAAFSKPAAAGWADPNFIPILIDSNPFSSDEEIQFDKDHGINTYASGLNEFTPWSLIATHGMYYIGDSYTFNGDSSPMPDSFVPWVGHRLGDETDGIYSNPQDGYDFLNGLVAGYGGRNTERFMYNNYTQQTVLSSWGGNGQPGSNYINNFTDAVSMDMYWYTIPDSSFGSAYVPSVNGPENPRSASSYGAMVRGMRQVDTNDGKLQPIWMFIENLSGGPAEQFVRYLTPGELMGAAMSTIIADARGIVWFNSAMSAPSGGSVYGNVMRNAQYDPDFVGLPQINAMSTVNHQVTALAPVINTQSYVWTFGANLDTMLKTYNGFAYIFAMCANNTTPGSRTFTLPTAVKGLTVTVLNESRTISVSDHQFTDTFAFEYTYHIYMVSVQ